LGVVLLLPQFQEIAWLGLIDTRAGLVLLYIAANLPLAVLFLRPAFAGVPEPLVESMRVEGVSALGVVRRLFVPLSTSTFVAVAVFVVVQVWGEIPLAVTLLNSPSRFPLAVFLALNFGGTGAIAIGWLSVLPPLALFLASQGAFPGSPLQFAVVSRLPYGPSGRSGLEASALVPKVNAPPMAGRGRLCWVP
jgi:multiple sugar transport system permease protein